MIEHLMKASIYGRLDEVFLFVFKFFCKVVTRKCFVKDVNKFHRIKSHFKIQICKIHIFFTENSFSRRKYILIYKRMINVDMFENINQNEKRRIFMWQKKCSVLLVGTMVVTSLGGANTVANAKAKPALAKKTVAIQEGKTKTVKLKNATGMKITVKVKKTSLVKVTSKTTKAIKLKGVKAGKTIVTVVVKNGKKKYTLKCNVTVKAAISTSATVTPTPEVTASPEVSASPENSGQPTPPALPDESGMPVPQTSELPIGSANPNVTPGATTVPTDQSLDNYVEPEKVDYEDVDSTSVDEYDATILLNNTKTAEVTGTNASNVTAEDGVVTLNADGNYYITGTLSEGYIKVAKNINVHIFLENADITCTENAPITIKGSSTSTTITLIGENSLSEEGAAMSTDSDCAAIEAQSPVVINGAGSLNIAAYRYCAIKVRSTLKIYNTNITVESSVDNGIVAKEALGIYDSVITVNNTAGDGIKVTKGYLDIQEGNIIIQCTGDGVNAATTAYLKPETLDITTNLSTVDTTSSCKGIKIASDDDITETLNSVLEIAGGKITIDSYENGIHCGNSDTDYNTGTIKMTGGTITINAGYKNGSYVRGTTSSGDAKSGNKGIHAKDGLYIDGSDIVVKHSFEGIEADAITIMSGNVDVTSTDDGINAAGESNTTNMVGDSAIIIYGGTVNVNASGDGIDVNGDFYMYGGEVYIDGPTNDGNGALDYDGVYELTGGTIIAVGSKGMSQAPSNSSQQPSMSINFTSAQSANSNISVKDASGNVLCSHQAAKQYTNAVISDTDFELGGTYYVYVDDVLIRTITFTSTNMMDNSNGSWGGGNTPGGFTPWH